MSGKSRPICPQPRPTKNAAPLWWIGDGQMDSKYQTLSSPIPPTISGGSYTLFRGDISHRTDRCLIHPSGRDCEEFYSMRLDKQASRIFSQINAGDGKQKFFQQGSLADV